MNKAVVGSAIQHISASQLKVFSSCPRKWWYEKVAGIKPPQTAAQFAGDTLHKQLDAYYKTGTPIEHEGLRSAVTECLPPRGTDVLSEHPESWDLGIEAAGIPVVGRIDLLYFCGPRSPSVYDLKTKSESSFRKYCLTPEQLQEDLQMLVYGKYAVEKHDAAIVTLVHLNVVKTKNKHKAVGTALSRDDILRKYDHLVVKPVERMKLVACLTTPDSLPTLENETSNFGQSPCDSFGGCPFRNECFSVKTQTSTKQGKSMFDELPSGPVSTSLADATPPLVQPATSLDFVLFIDCLPVKGAVVSPLEDVIARHSAPICKLNNVTDVREIDFGKGTRALIASMLKETWVGTYTCSSQGLGGLVSEALLPQAKVVIRGCR